MFDFLPFLLRMSYMYITRLDLIHFYLFPAFTFPLQLQVLFPIAPWNLCQTHSAHLVLRACTLAHDCSDWNENDPYRLVHLNTWAPVVEVFGKESGEVQPCCNRYVIGGWALSFPNPKPLSVGSHSVSQSQSFCALTTAGQLWVEFCHPLPPPY